MEFMQDIHIELSKNQTKELEWKMNVYDFDHTIYKGDSTINFYLFCLKNNFIIVRNIPKQLFGMILYMAKKLIKHK